MAEVDDPIRVLGIRVPDSTRELLEERAWRNRRTVSAEGRLIIESALGLDPSASFKPRRPVVPKEVE